MDTLCLALNTTKLGLPLGAMVLGRDSIGIRTLLTPMLETLNFGFALPVPPSQLGAEVTYPLEEDPAFLNWNSPTGATMLGLVVMLFLPRTLQLLAGMETH